MDSSQTGQMRQSIDLSYYFLVIKVIAVESMYIHCNQPEYEPDRANGTPYLSVIIKLIIIKFIVSKSEGHYKIYLKSNLWLEM